MEKLLLPLNCAVQAHLVPLQMAQVIQSLQETFKLFVGKDQRQKAGAIQIMAGIMAAQELFAIGQADKKCARVWI